MKIWQLKEPYDSDCAYFSLEGTWKETTDQEELCPECTGPPPKVRVKPMVIKWEPGSDVISDFVWAMAGTRPLIQTRVLEMLCRQLTGCEPGPVKMTQVGKLKRPQKPSSRVKPRVWLPYEGPPLSELWIKARVHVDPKRSTIRQVLNCSTCGNYRYEVDSIETIKSRWNKDRMALDKIHTHRIAGKGLFVHQDDLKGADIFSIRELPYWTFCTDNAKRFIEEEDYSNVSFLEVGDQV